MAKDKKTTKAEAEAETKRLSGEALGIVDRKNNSHKYRPNKRNRAVRRQVYARYYTLRDNDARKLAEEDWEIGDKEFRMYFPEEFGDNVENDQRSHLHLPDAFAAIQAHQQETVERKSRPAVASVERSDEPIEAFANAVLNHNMNTTDYDYQWYLGKLNAAIRGTTFFKDYWRLDKRVISDPTDVDEDGNIIYTPKEVVDFDDDYLEWVENEYIFIDEKARHIDFAVDGVEREILEIDEFRRVYANKAGFFDVDKVVEGGDTSTRGFFKLPHDMLGNDVEILHYYNRAIDAYWVVANNVTIYDGPIPFKHKELPWAVLYHYQVPGRFWGLGIPKIIHYLSEERRSIRNMNMDRQHLQINKMFIHNNAFDLDEEELTSRPNGLVSIDTNGQDIRSAIMPLEYGDVPSSYFRTEEILLEDIRRAHGIDDRIQGVNVGGTATEAAILKESALKRVNMVSTIAEMDTVKRIGRLKWANIQFFYPVGRMEKITENNKQRNKKILKTVATDGKKFSIVNENGQNRLKMEEVEGVSSFELKKDLAGYLGKNFNIVVDSSVFAPPSKVIQQTKVAETFSIIMANPATAATVDPVKASKRLFEVNDEKPADWMKEGSEYTRDQMMMLADAENMIMAAGQPLSPTKGATEDHTLIHIMFTKTKDFEELPDEIQALITDHIMGEHDANPNTGSAAQLMQGAGASPEGMAPGANPMGVNPMGIAADTQAPQLQAADMTPGNAQAES